MNGAQRQKSGRKRFPWGFRLALSLVVLITLALVGVIAWLVKTQDLDKLSTRLGILASMVTIVIGLPTLFFTVVKWPDSESPHEQAPSFPSSGSVQAEEIRATNVANIQHIAQQNIYLPNQKQESGDDQSTRNTSSPLWNVPHRRNLFFTGRDQFLQELHNGLMTKSNTPTQPQALCGLGGIGKTQIAVEYVYRYHDEYKAVLWAKADNRESLILNLCRIAGVLNLHEQNEIDQNIVVGAVIRWLETHENWLLVLDNVEDLVMAFEYLPTLYKGQILLTTRIQAIGSLAGRIEIKEMNLQEGTLFLLQRAKLLIAKALLEDANIEDRTNAEAIVREMGGLPLALEQVGAYIEETGCSLSSYLPLYHRSRKDLLKRQGSLPLLYPHTVATTWSLSFRHIEQMNRSAADLLRFCAFLDPDSISEQIITEGAPELGPVIKLVAADAFKLNEAIELLLSCSLVRRNSTTRTISIHRLVQMVLVDRMKKRGNYSGLPPQFLVVGQVFLNPVHAHLSI